MHPATQRVVAAAAERGLSIDVVEFAQSTRTAQAAADAIGCDVAQIVKSLCFTANDAPVMALVSGANMLDTKKLAGELGIGRKRSNAPTPTKSAPRPDSPSVVCRPSAMQNR